MGLGHKSFSAEKARDPASCQTNPQRETGRLPAFESLARSELLKYKTHQKNLVCFDLVPEERLELSTLARRDFESRAYTIPPLRQYEESMLTL
jgi:hypothetical protein